MATDLSFGLGLISHIERIHEIGYTISCPSCHNIHTAYSSILTDVIGGYKSNVWYCDSCCQIFIPEY